MPREILDVEQAFAGSDEFRVRHIIRHSLRVDQRFNSNWETIHLAARLAACCDKADVPGTSVLIDEGDWEKLCEALRNPAPPQGQPAYCLAPAYACAPIIAQVLNAAKKDPSP